MSWTAFGCMWKHSFLQTLLCHIWVETRVKHVSDSLIENDGWNRFFFQNPCVPPCISDSDKNTSDPHTKRRGVKRQVSPKNKRERAGKKRRYMKSSCRWTTIHFHFEVLRTVVKCDCMWQSPSLPVYHDGYTLPPWRCYSRMYAHARAHTHMHKNVDAETHRGGSMQLFIWTQT